MSFIDFLFFGGYGRTIDLCLERSRTGKQTKIFTPNAEMLASATKSAALMRLLRSADLPLPDGVGVYLGARLLGLSPQERTNGIDLAERLLTAAEQNEMSVFLLGAKRGVAQRAARRLELRFPKLKIAGFHHGYFEKQGKENDAVIEKIRRSGAEILFVCLGFPEQEGWISKNMPRLSSVKIAAALGGSIDVWAGKTVRAPESVRKMGLEWLWRAVSSPRRVARLPEVFSFAALCTSLKLSEVANRGVNLLRNR